jgi:dihydrodipicolinate synthase/N-acetylneuraminate lyase
MPKKDKGLRKPLKGVFPLIPFAVKGDQEIDLDGLQHNVDFLARSGVPGLIAFGCMGEFYAPSEQEWNTVVEAAVQAAAGRLAVVVGSTFQNAREAVRRTVFAEKAGADGVMAAAPYVINVNEDVVYQYYRAMNDAATEIQIMVYNYPPLPHGFNMTPAFWDRLLDLERVKAVKESNGDVWHRANVISKIKDRINVFSGGEGWLFSDVLLGAKGLVSLFGIAEPKTVMKLFGALERRDLEVAIPLYRKFTELCSYITGENEVAFLKATAEIGGQKAGRPRAPYQALDPGTRKTVEKYLSELSRM